MWGFGIKRNKTDALFSDLVRWRAKWKCELCFKEPDRQRLHCSHFIGRGNKAVRWDLENAAALCVYCHKKMTEDPAAHFFFFERRLGKEKLEALIFRSHLTYKGMNGDEKLLRIGLKEELKKLKKDTLGAR